MAVVTLSTPITLPAGATDVTITLSSGYSMRLVGGAAVEAIPVAHPFEVDQPLDQAVLMLPIACSGLTEPNAQVRIYNNATGVLLRILYADADGKWSDTLTVV